jgi:hypothetical protein
MLNQAPGISKTVLIHCKLDDLTEVLILSEADYFQPIISNFSEAIGNLKHLIAVFLARLIISRSRQ